MIRSVLDILTVLTLLLGFFFMFVGALGVLRLPDVFNRMHASSKCVTLGICGILAATVLHFAKLYWAPDIEGPAWNTLIGASTKAVLVMVFLFTAALVGTHMLARAAMRRPTDTPVEPTTESSNPSPSRK